MTLTTIHTENKKFSPSKRAQVRRRHLAGRREGKLNKNLQQANQELYKLKNEINTLTGIIAHDLKSPMNRIEGIVKILELEGNLTENQLDYLGLILEVVHSCKKLIAGLLEITTLEETMRPVITSVNLDEFLKKKVAILNILAASKEITIKLDQSVTETVHTDITYVDRILDNLITNATKFSPQGTSVFVKVYSENNFLAMKVKDQGPGFNAEDKKNLYQKFRKLSAHPTARENSQGLGLFIVKKLVEQLNGNIELISVEGSGSEFIVMLPISSLQ